MARTHTPADQQSEEEAHALLSSSHDGASDIANSASSRGSASAPSHDASKEVLKSAGSVLVVDVSKDVGICRICLEEDLVTNLEAPCMCSGTQRYAHHTCIQRWVTEKSNARCEICQEPYRGSYTVPPPPAAAPLDSMPLFTPLYVLETSDPRHPYHHQGLDMLDAEAGVYQRNPSVSWCVSFIIFFLFMVVLHHTLVVADGMSDPSSPGASPGDASGGAPSGGDAGAGPGLDDSSVAASLVLFLLWLATKALLIGIPLLAVMRIASRQAQREHYEAMLAAAGQYHHDNAAAGTRRMVIRVRPSGSNSHTRSSSTSTPSSGAAAAAAGNGLGVGSSAAVSAGGRTAVPPPMVTVV